MHIVIYIHLDSWREVQAMVHKHWKTADIDVSAPARKFLLHAAAFWQKETSSMGF